MTSVVPFDRSHAGEVVAFWRLLHPDWTWRGDAEETAEMLAPVNAFERIGFVVRRKGRVIASVFGTCTRDPTWPRTRVIRIEARPEDLAAEWLDDVLASFAEADRGHPDTWHVTNPGEMVAPVLAPMLEAAGFVHRSTLLRIAWSGDSVTHADPSPARFERYAGGNRDIDGAIVELHNRSYRPSRLVPPAELERLWRPRPDLEMREYVLAMIGDRVVGHAEWWVADGKAWINSLAVARSHWGTSIGAALGAKTMQVLLDLGHRQMAAMVRSNNPAVMRLWQGFGWAVASELSRTFVRKL